MLNMSILVTENFVNTTTDNAIQVNSVISNLNKSQGLLDIQSSLVFEDSTLPGDTRFDCLARNRFISSRQTITLMQTEDSSKLMVV